MSSLPKLVAIVGPTASGKTAWALELARECGGEIVSADSRQIYRELTIGTSKPYGVWQNDQYLVGDVPYHLVDVVEPDEAFTVAHYQRRACSAIDAILGRNKVPFLVGGTGLYVRAVVDNLAIPAVKPNQRLRTRLSEKSSAELAEMLRKLDPASAAAVDPANSRRLIRAIEVALGTHQSSATSEAKGPARYETLQIGITKPKEELYTTIDQRVDEMIEEGLVHEVESLLKKYRRTLPALSGIGYAEIIQYLDGLRQPNGLSGRPDLRTKSGLGAISLEKAIRLIKTHTRQYAKRQMTWFKRDKRVHWTLTLVEAQHLVASFLNGAPRQ